MRPGEDMKRTLALTLLLSLGAVGLSGCYVVSPYGPPAYVPPSPPPPPPPYVPPAAAPRPPSGSPSPAPGAGKPAPGSAQSCQTVTVEGHSETVVRQNGQRETFWVPTHQQHVCQ